MTETFSTLIDRAQKAIAANLEADDNNPVSVVCGEVALIVAELTAHNLAMLIGERPETLKHTPTDFYYGGGQPSGEDAVRACIQIEIEKGIDLIPLSASVHRWFQHIFRPPQHLRSKMREIVQAA